MANVNMAPPGVRRGPRSAGNTGRSPDGGLVRLDASESPSGIFQSKASKNQRCPHVVNRINHRPICNDGIISPEAGPTSTAL